MKSKWRLFLVCLLAWAVCGCEPSSREAGPGVQATPGAADTPTAQPTAPSLPPLGPDGTSRSPSPVPATPFPSALPGTASGSHDPFERLAALFDYDPQAPLDLDLDVEGFQQVPISPPDQEQPLGVEQEGIRLYDLTYASPKGGRVTASLVVPPGEGPFAGLIFMHGGPADRSQFLSEAVMFAEMGAVAVLIDGPASRPEPWRRNPPLSDMEAYRDTNVQAVVDLRRAVDVLASRPEVDVNRLGFVGHSYGAILGGVLAGVEHRIQAYVLMAAYPRFVDAMPPGRGTPQYIQAMAPIDPIHYVGHAAPSALFFQYGFYDQTIPPDMALEHIEEASGPKQSKWYHDGHGLNVKAFYDRAEWLAGELGLNTAPLDRLRPQEGSPATASLGDTWTRPVDGMGMAYVPAGQFVMGSDDPFYNNQRPPHTVTLAAFWIDRTEVTNAQYRLCVEAGVCKPPRATGSLTRPDYFDNRLYDDYPVIHVSWYQAAAYCKWAGGRLPTEEEWEYAARGSDERRFPWGDVPDGTRLNYCDLNCPLEHADQAFDDGYADTAPVGTYPAGASWCGALDMVGNVWEWVADWYGFYPSEENPAWLRPTMQDRVIRGGAWDTDGGHAHCTFRNWFNPAKAHDSIGFRCAVSQPAG